MRRRVSDCLEYSRLVKAGAVLFNGHRVGRNVRESFLEEGGIEGKGLKLRDGQPIEAEGVAHLIQSPECLQGLCEKRSGWSRQQEIQSKLMPGAACIRKKILDDVEQAPNLEDLTQLLLRLSEQRDPRGLTHFRPSPRQKPEALFARRLAQHVFVLDENPTDAIGEADLAWFEGNQATRCVVHRVLLFLSVSYNSASSSGRQYQESHGIKRVSFLLYGYCIESNGCIATLAYIAGNLASFRFGILHSIALPFQLLSVSRAMMRSLFLHTGTIVRRYKAEQYAHFPNSRWVSVAIKVTSMSSPTKASRAARMVRGSSSAIPPGKKPRPWNEVMLNTHARTVDRCGPPM